MKAELRPGERLDDLQINDYYIIQNPDKFCFGMDAVLLSSFAHCAPGSKVADFGTGTGIIPILLTAKTEAAHIDALEIQTESADMARRSVQYNGLTDKINIINGDIKEASSLLGKASCSPADDLILIHTADHVLCGVVYTGIQPALRIAEGGVQGLGKFERILYPP